MKDFFKMDVTKEELEFLTEQLKDFREKNAREEEIKKTKERIRNDIKRLYDLTTVGCVIDLLEEVVRIDLNLDYKWAED